ncbi:hypothetical protein VP177E371_P0035 [Vibrio phage 177E37-1]|nr:hypothetical protein VP177E371_P0035 [Vibrio phage 177E37-1]
MIEDLDYEILIPDAESGETEAVLFVEDNCSKQVKSVHIGVYETVGHKVDDASMALDKEGAEKLIAYLNKFFNLEK